MENRTFAQLKTDRIHVAPRALELSSSGAQQRFIALWAPLEELSGRLQGLPTGLLRFWLQQPGGHIVITHLASGYNPGTQMLKRHVLHNVASISVSDLARDSLEALVPVGYLLNHLLGNCGAAEGAWLSEGGGASAALRAVGARVAELFALGYGFDEAAQADARTYLSRSLALYLYDVGALNVADPLLDKCLRSTLFSAAFWRSKKAQSLVA
jgi:hypothetical protein